jgi:hypothetical protein
MTGTERSGLDLIGLKSWQIAAKSADIEDLRLPTVDDNHSAACFANRGLLA